MKPSAYSQDFISLKLHCVRQIVKIPTKILKGNILGLTSLGWVSVMIFIFKGIFVLFNHRNSTIKHCNAYYSKIRILKNKKSMHPMQNSYMTLATKIFRSKSKTERQEPIVENTAANL